jgi:hypothetical protein
MLDGNGLDSGEGGLRRRLRSTDEPVDAGPPRGLGGDERARHGAHAPVQRQLSESCVLSQALGRDLVRRGKDRKSDREVEARALLPQARGRKVDGEPTERQLYYGARYPSPEPLIRLLAGIVRQADDGKRGDAALEVCLDLDRPGFEPDESMGGGARKHTSTLRRESVQDPHRSSQDRAAR